MSTVTRVLRDGFWTDPELARWPLPQRIFYIGLQALAEDSGVVEDDPFGWKLALFPSPVDVEITVDVLTAWAEEMVQAGKITRFEASGKPFLFLERFHTYQKPPNPRDTNLPLPPWCKRLVHGQGQGKRVIYEVVPRELRNDCAETAQSQHDIQVGLGLDGLGLERSGKVGTGGGSGEGDYDLDALLDHNALNLRPQERKETKNLLRGLDDHKAYDVAFEATAEFIQDRQNSKPAQTFPTYVRRVLERGDFDD